MKASGGLGFLGAIVHRQSYFNIVYLLLGLPLGIAYFVFLVTGLSLGFGLLITLAGIPILLGVLGGSWVLCGFERKLAIALLNEDIPLPTLQPSSPGMWPRLKRHLTNRLTWSGMFYLFLIFPLGIGTFVMAVTLISVTFALMSAPLYYWVDDGIDIGIWRVDMLWEALILTLASIPILFISLNVMNATAFLSGRLARVMLGKLS